MISKSLHYLAFGTSFNDSLREYKTQFNLKIPKYLQRVNERKFTLQERGGKKK